MRHRRLCQRPTVSWKKLWGRLHLALPPLRTAFAETCHNLQRFHTRKKPCRSRRDEKWWRWLSERLQLLKKVKPYQPQPELKHHQVGPQLQRRLMTTWPRSWFHQCQHGLSKQHMNTQMLQHNLNKSRHPAHQQRWHRQKQNECQHPLQLHLIQPLRLPWIQLLRQPLRPPNLHQQSCLPDLQHQDHVSMKGSCIHHRFQPRQNLQHQDQLSMSSMNIPKRPAAFLASKNRWLKNVTVLLNKPSKTTCSAAGTQSQLGSPAGPSTPMPNTNASQSSGPANGAAPPVARGPPAAHPAAPAQPPQATAAGQEPADSEDGRSNNDDETRSVGGHSSTTSFSQALEKDLTTLLENQEGGERETRRNEDNRDTARPTQPAIPRRRRARTVEEKAIHAKFMRFTRHIQSFLSLLTLSL